MSARLGRSESTGTLPRSKSRLRFPAGSLFCGVVALAVLLVSSATLIAGCVPSRYPTPTHSPKTTVEAWSEANELSAEYTAEARLHERYETARAEEVATLEEQDARDATSAALDAIEATIDAQGGPVWCTAADPQEALAYLGQEVCIEFVVEYTRRFEQQVFLDSKFPYEGHFYVYVPQSLWGCWTASPEEFFLGHRVIVFGKVEAYYAGWPEIVLGACTDIWKMD